MWWIPVVLVVWGLVGPLLALALGQGIGLADERERPPLSVVRPVLDAV